MRIVVVGNRDGQAVIYWPGVLMAALMIVLIGVVTCVLFALATGWWKVFDSLLFSLPMLFGTVLFGGIRRALRMPPETLPAL